MKILTQVTTLEKYRQAIERFEEGRYRQAIAMFQGIISRNPSPHNLHHRLATYYCTQSHYYIARIHFALGNYQEARAEFETVLRMNPERNEIYKYLAACYHSSGETRKAQDAIDKRISVIPSPVDDQVMLASMFLQKQLWQKTSSTIERRMSLHPNHADAHYYLGLTSLGKGAPLQAIEHFNRSLAINPQYWKTRIKLGIVHAFLGNHELAQSQLSVVLRRFPDYPDISYYLGIVHSSRSEFDLAAEAFAKTLDLNPSFVNARIKLAITQWSTGKPLEARELLRDGVRINPKDHSLAGLLRYIDILNTRSRPNSALSSPPGGKQKRLFPYATDNFHRHIVIAPNFSEMFSLIRQVVSVEQRLNTELLDIIRAPFTTYMNYPDYHYEVGSTYMKARKHLDAEKSFQTALEINPNYLQAQLLLFHSLRMRKEPESALDAAQLLLEKKISYPDFHYNLGEVYLSLNLEEKALEAFERTLQLNPGYEKARAAKASLIEKKGRP
jgi:tetratricopeptide (TPR) repeat protein